MDDGQARRSRLLLRDERNRLRVRSPPAIRCSLDEWEDVRAASPNVTISRQ
jgi:hypothetical protein